MSRAPIDDDEIDLDVVDIVDVGAGIDNNAPIFLQSYSDKIEYELRSVDDNDLIKIFLELRDYAEQNALFVLNTRRAGTAFVEWIRGV